jgi:hypothetical protein
LENPVPQRNTLVNAWLHRRLRSALRWTVFTVVDTPKNADFARGILLTLRGLPWVLRERAPASRASSSVLTGAARRPASENR